jgi:hypothetical protein
VAAQIASRGSRWTPVAYPPFLDLPWGVATISQQSTMVNYSGFRLEIVNFVFACGCARRASNKADDDSQRGL